MILFENNSEAVFHLDNITKVKKTIKMMGIECRILTPSLIDQQRGANEGQILFNNEMSEFEQNFLSK